MIGWFLVGWFLLIVFIGWRLWLYGERRDPRRCPAAGAAVTGPRFAHALKSPHSAPHVGDPLLIKLTPHRLGGYELSVRLENGFTAFDGLATASDLRELAAKFYAAAAALTGDPAP